MANLEKYDSHIHTIVNERRNVLNPMMSISYHPQPLKLHSAKGQYLYE